MALRYVVVLLLTAGAQMSMAYEPGARAGSEAATAAGNQMAGAASVVVDSVAQGLIMAPLAVLDDVMKPIDDLLQTTRQQKAELQALRQEIAADLEELSKRQPSERPAALKQKLKALDAKYLPRLMALLTPEQQQRFHGIRLQMQGAARGLHDPDVAATLHLTTSQRAQLDALFSQLSTDDNRDKPTSKPSRRFSVTPTGKSRASGVARLPLLLAKRAVFDGLALDVLTAEQKEAYAKLTGDKLPIANWLAGKHEVVATHAPEPSQTTVAEPPAK